MPVPVAGIFDFSFWQTVAAIGSAVTAYAQSRVTPDPLDDLERRLRHPLRWALRHPLRAARRRRL